MLKLGGLQYKVTALTADEIQEVSGRVDEQYLLIKIQDDLHPAVHDEVFLHELGHIFGTRWTRSHSDRERFADDFASFVLSFLRQNNLLREGWSRKLRDDLPHKEDKCKKATQTRHCKKRR